MKIVELLDNDHEICNVNWEMDKSRFTIKWTWPKNIDIVFILKTNIIYDFSLEHINKNNVKLYTREEYKEFNGYCETVKDVNQYAYYIFPAIEEKGEILLLKQQNGKNKVLISTGKPKIYYEIKQLRTLKNIFSKEKVLQITIDSEIELNKDVLCYVKKLNSYPLNKKDGIAFDFIDNISAGKNIMPPIIVYKNEYVKVFIKDIDRYGSIYILKER